MRDKVTIDEATQARQDFHRIIAASEVCSDELRQHAKYLENIISAEADYKLGAAIKEIDRAGNPSPELLGAFQEAAADVAELYKLSPDDMNLVIESIRKK